MNYYPRHLGDYLKATNHLSLAEHGALNLLLDRLYGSEKPITRQEAFEICRPTTKADKQAVSRVLADFFFQTAEGYVNRRALLEIEKYHEKSAKARQAILTRWNVNSAEKRKKADTDVLRTNNERNTIPVTNNQYPLSNNQNTNLVSIKDLLGERAKR